MITSNLKIISLGLIAVVVIFLLIFYNNKEFATNIINPIDFEILKEGEFISCQVDCTFGDGVFREECVGFNGCKDSSYLRNKSYCERSSDCIINYGCCISKCSSSDCYGLDYCNIANKEYVNTHEFSCKNNVWCLSSQSCKEPEKIKCIQNQCEIII